MAHGISGAYLRCIHKSEYPIRVLGGKWCIRASKEASNTYVDPSPSNNFTFSKLVLGTFCCKFFNSLINATWNTAPLFLQSIYKVLAFLLDLKQSICILHSRKFCYPRFTWTQNRFKLTRHLFLKFYPHISSLVHCRKHTHSFRVLRTEPRDWRQRVYYKTNSDLTEAPQPLTNKEILTIKGEEGVY